MLTNDPTYKLLLENLKLAESLRKVLPAKFVMNQRTCFLLQRHYAPDCKTLSGVPIVIDNDTPLRAIRIYNADGDLLNEVKI